MLVVALLGSPYSSCHNNAANLSHNNGCSDLKSVVCYRALLVFPLLSNPYCSCIESPSISFLRLPVSMGRVCVESLYSSLI